MFASRRLVAFAWRAGTVRLFPFFFWLAAIALLPAVLAGVATPAQATIANMTSPAPGSTLSGATVSFSWDAGSGVSQYWLWVGTSAGNNDLYTQSQGTSRSGTVNGLPTDGRTLYVRLWSLVAGAWQFNDYTYGAAGAAQKAAMTAPVPGSTLPGASVTFGWSSGSGVSQYWLYVGTSAGGNDLYGQSQGTSHAITVNGLPTDGRTLYVRLWSLIAGAWQFNDYTYTAAGTSQKAAMTAPAPTSTLPGAMVTFAWSSGSGVSQYWLWVGTSANNSDVYTQSQGSSLSGTVSGLPTDGRTLYVRLWSLIAGAWQFNDYIYTAATTAGLKAAISTPAPGSTLSGATVSFGWDAGSGVSQYWLWVGTSAAGNDLYTQSQGTGHAGTVSGLPTDGRTLYVRLWSLIAGAWQFNDYVYHAAGLSQKSAMTSPVPGSTLPGSSVAFAWSSGSGVSQYWLYVGTAAGGNDLYGLSQGSSLSVTVNGLPTDGRTLYVRLWSLLAGAWQFSDYTYTAARSSAQGFLASPLACGDPNCAFQYSQGAYTPGIMNSVVDHHLIQNANKLWQFGKTTDKPQGGDGIVVAFNGDMANGAQNDDPTCISISKPFLAPLFNSRGCGPGFASYDEHPGYDYLAAMNTKVFAAAGGVVVNNVALGEPCVRTNIPSCATFNYVGIDHGNGYITQYGHLAVGTVLVTPGQTVVQGQQIGLSGHTGLACKTTTTCPDHLHFEVIKLIGSTKDYNNPLIYAVVDPYGWVGTGTDPLYSVGLGIPPAKLWQ